MSKALVINGANFSANKLTTVVLADTPCTGIEITSSAFTFTDYSTGAVNYTVTPADTTDEVLWSSSDTSVATVNNGVITPVGLGTATITATCGAYSDTVTVTVAIVYTSNYRFYALSHADGRTFVSCTPNSYSRLSAAGTGDQMAAHYCPSSLDTDHLYPVLIPNNTASITISYDMTNHMYDLYNVNYRVYWLSDESCGDRSFPDAALYISEEEYALRGTGSVTVDVPSGANAFTFYVRTSTTYTSDDNATTVASNLGVVATFNAAS